MDRRLLRYYEGELRHLRETAGEFAREFPKIAGRLSLDEFACSDPYVERLLEGFAFLAARVQLKLDAEFPRFTQHLLETVYPHYLVPTPSMVIAQFTPDLTEAGLADGFDVPRDTVLRSLLGKGDQTPCEYRTAHDLTLWPIRLVEAQYYTRDLASLALPDQRNAKAGLRLRLAATAGLSFHEIQMDRLVLYLRGTDDLPMRLYEQFFAHTVGLVGQAARTPSAWHEYLEPDSVGRIGFDSNQAMLPHGPRSFQGYRLLHEYFAFPDRFLFVELSNLNMVLRHCGESQLDLILLFDEADLNLEGVVDVSSFMVHCTPAVNLFPKRADRIQVSDRFPEYHVVPDRTRPIDFEVYEVTGVTGFGAKAADEQEFQPFYSASDFEDGGASGSAYFAVKRQPRRMSDREKRVGRRSTYAGSEVFVSLVDAASAPFKTDLSQLGVSTLCTNRDLPLQMPVGQGRTDFTLETGGPIDAVHCVAGPTAPRASHAEGEVAWRAISHLSLNYLSLVDRDDDQGAEGLRDILKLYANVADSAIRAQIDGVRAVHSEPIVRRVSTPGPISFARGLEVSVTLDENAFQGSGVFVLGAVLEEFFAKHVSINSFTETVVRTTDRGEIMRWPARLGRRHLL